MDSNCAPKGSVNSVRSVRDKTPHYEYPTIFLSQKITEEQNTQGFTETLSQPITQSVTANRSLTPSPSPNGEGSDHRDTPTYPPDV